MHKYRFTELICIISAIVFIIFTQQGEAPTDMSANEIFSLLEEASADELCSRDKLYMKDKLGIELDGESFVWYSSDDVMNVNELIVAVADDAQLNELKSLLEEYVDEKYKLFNGYAPEEAALLGSAVIEIKANVLFFCVGESADELYASLISLM